MNNHISTYLSFLFFTENESFSSFSMLPGERGASGGLPGVGQRHLSVPHGQQLRDLRWPRWHQLSVLQGVQPAAQFWRNQRQHEPRQAGLHHAAQPRSQIHQVLPPTQRSQSHSLVLLSPVSEVSLRFICLYSLHAVSCVTPLPSLTF